MKVARGLRLPEQLSLLELLERPTIEALFEPDALFEVEDAEFLRTMPEQKSAIQNPTTPCAAEARMAEPSRTQLDKFKEVARELERFSSGLNR